MRPFLPAAVLAAALSGLLVTPVCLLAQNQAPTTAMAATVETLLDAQPAAARAHWGISLVDAATGATLYAKNETQLFQPASNAKLFTTSAALALLGPTFTMSTRVVAEGALGADGTLHGNLRLVGGADPTMSGRAYPYAGHTDRPNPPLAALDALAAQVLASGVHAVDGEVLADDTLFPQEPYGAAWSWDDLQWDYGAPISALVVNDNVRYLTITPGTTVGAALTTSWLPDVAGLPGSLLVTGVTAAAGTRAALGVARDPGTGSLRVFGTLPLGGQPVHLALAVDDPARFAGQAFAASLIGLGIPVSGGSAAVHRPSEDTQAFTAETTAPLTPVALPAGAGSLPTAGSTMRIVASRQSLPLSDTIVVTNKVSQNLHAELLLHLLGRAEGADGSAAQGARVVRSFATLSAGVAPDDFLLYDGSGLSTKDLATPRALTTLLRYSTTQSWGPLLRSSLPASGVDGTLAGRFPALRGRVQAKTGTLGEVDALSGFLTTDTGRLVLFSVLCNDHPGPGSRALIDAIVEAAARDF